VTPCAPRSSAKLSPTPPDEGIPEHLSAGPLDEFVD